MSGDRPASDAAKPRSHGVEPVGLGVLLRPSVNLIDIDTPEVPSTLVPFPSTDDSAGAVYPLVRKRTQTVDGFESFCSVNRPRHIRVPSPCSSSGSRRTLLDSQPSHSPAERTRRSSRRAERPSRALPSSYPRFPRERGSLARFQDPFDPFRCPRHRLVILEGWAPLAIVRAGRDRYSPGGFGSRTPSTTDMSRAGASPTPGAFQLANQPSEHPRHLPDANVSDADRTDPRPGYPHRRRSSRRS